MSQESLKARFVSDLVLERAITAFIPIEKQVLFKKEQLEQLIDTIEEELILKKAKDIQEKRKK